MTLRRGVLGLIAGSMAVSACANEEAPWPQPPKGLVWHDETPFGDVVSRRIARATIAAYDRLEPDWGKLRNRLYSLPAGQRAAFGESLKAGMPAGWKPVDLPGFAPPHGELFAYASGRRLFAVLVVDPGITSDIPVTVIHNGDRPLTGPA